jgi:hypothetical protein
MGRAMRYNAGQFFRLTVMETTINVPCPGRLGTKILFHKIFGAVAQLGERLVRNQKVASSILASSTTYT